MVTALAARWGVTLHDDSRVVWADLARNTPRPDTRTVLLAIETRVLAESQLRSTVRISKNVLRDLVRPALILTRRYASLPVRDRPDGASRSRA
jgi:hypothetical protein